MRNGYNPSIIPYHSETQCWACGANGRGKMDRHEVFGGAYRQKSKRLGLWVNLCHEPCHLTNVHAKHLIDEQLKAEAQYCAMKTYGWTKEDFKREFGRNYFAESR